MQRLELEVLTFGIVQAEAGVLVDEVPVHLPHALVEELGRLVNA